MKRRNLPSPERRGENLLCGVASVLFPVSILCYFCAQNINEFVALWLIYFMLGTIVLLSALAYCVALLILRRGFLALTFCLICWIGCYFEPAITLTFFSREDMTYSRTLLCAAFLILAAAVLAVCLLRRFKWDVRKPVILFSAFFALILMFNLLPILRAGFSERVGGQAAEQLYRSDFAVDPAKTDTPNIYWIHPDGMMSVDMVEKYFRDDQSEFLSALRARGFSVNPSAHFEAGGRTSFAIPILTSPYAYDTWISGYTASHEAVEQASASYAFMGGLREVNLNNEMLVAFAKKGYASNAISFGSDVYYPSLSDGAFYNVLSNRDEVEICSEKDMENWLLLQSMRTNSEEISRFLRWVFEVLYKIIFADLSPRWYEDLSALSIGTSQPFGAKMPEEQLSRIMPNNILHLGAYHEKMIKSLYDILHGGTQDPKIAVVHDFMPHPPFIMDENGALADHKESYNPVNYYPQHVFSAKVIIGMVDMILEADPDAVIVIQADHGQHHMFAEEDFKAAFGEDADALELWNGTMSAIRVPEKYRTGEEHYAEENPLNISRYLVNSFVGENYEYLPPN